MTLDGQTNNAKDALPVNPGQPSGGEGSSPSDKPAKTYTEEEVTKLKADYEKQISTRHSALDKQIAALNKELGTYKSQLEQNQTQFKSHTDEVTKLRQQIDELAADDPDKKKLVMKLRLVEEQEAELNKNKSAYDEEKKVWGPLLEDYKKQKAHDEFMENITNIAEKFEGADANKLAEYCEELGITEPEKIEKAATLLWKAKPKGVPVPHRDSGDTRGGADNTDKLSPTEKIEEGLKRAQKNK